MKLRISMKEAVFSQDLDGDMKTEVHQNEKARLIHPK